MYEPLHDPIIQEIEDHNQALRRKISLLNEEQELIQKKIALVKENQELQTQLDLLLATSSIQKTKKVSEDALSPQILGDLFLKDDLLKKNTPKLEPIKSSPSPKVYYDTYTIKSPGLPDECLEGGEVRAYFGKDPLKDFEMTWDWNSSKENRAWFIPGNKICCWSETGYPRKGEKIFVLTKSEPGSTVRIVNETTQCDIKQSNGSVIYTCLITPENIAKGKKRSSLTHLIKEINNVQEKSQGPR